MACLLTKWDMDIDACHAAKVSAENEFSFTKFKTKKSSLRIRTLIKH